MPPTHPCYQFQPPPMYVNYPLPPPQMYPVVSAQIPYYPMPILNQNHANLSYPIPNTSYEGTYTSEDPSSHEYTSDNTRKGNLISTQSSNTLHKGKLIVMKRKILII